MNAVVLHQVCKTRKDFSIESMNLSIPKGYMTGLVGPNGSGKTTLIRLMMNLIHPDAGSISLFGEPHHQPHLRENIGFVYEDLYFYEHFTLSQMKKAVAPAYPAWNDALFHTYADRFSLPLTKKIKQFSKGMKMKASLLFALAHEPELLIMDEPTAGLDPVFRRELLTTLQEYMMMDENRTILFSTHITSDLDQIADFLIFIDNGRLVLEQDMDTVREQYHIIKGPTELIDRDTAHLFIGLEQTAVGFRGLFHGDTAQFQPIEEVVIEMASLEDIMYHVTRKEHRV